MRQFRLHRPDILNLGVFTGTVLDPIDFGRNGMQAVIPAPDFVNGAQMVPLNSALLVYGGTWAAGVTTTVNSNVSITYTGYGVRFTFAVGPYGGIAFVTLDGAPRLAFDTYAPASGTATYTVYSPDGLTHTIVLTYYGDIAADNRAAVVTQPVPGTGTSLSGKAHTTRHYRGNQITGTHTITALDASHVSVDGSGSYAVNATYTNVPAGVDLTLDSATLTTGDTATFSTTATGLTLSSVSIATQVVANATYQTPVIDSGGRVFPIVGDNGDPSQAIATPLAEPGEISMPIQWVCALWEENANAPITQVTAQIGGSLGPISTTWQYNQSGDYTQGFLGLAHSTYNGEGCLGMAVLPVAQYSNLIFTIPQGGYLRNVRLFGWDYASDGEGKRFPPVPFGPVSQRVHGILVASHDATVRSKLREAVVGMAAGSAITDLLDLRGADWNFSRPYNSDDTRYAQALRYFISARTKGATPTFINQLLALLLGPGVAAPISAQPSSSASWVLGTSSLGVDTFLGTGTVGALQAVLSINASALTLPPQIVQQLAELFRPIGVLVTYDWS